MPTNLQKPLFTMLLGLDHFASVMELVLGSRLSETHQLRCFYFSKSSELLQLTETREFDVVFLYFANIEWDVASLDGSKSYPGSILSSYWDSAGNSGDGGTSGLERLEARLLEVSSVLQGIKEKFGKPILASQGVDLTDELEAKGIIFLAAPFSLKDLCARLEPQLGISLSSHTGKGLFSVAVCGHTPDDDFSSLYLTPYLEELLGNQYFVSSHYFPYASQWEATTASCDLYVILLNPVLLEPGSSQEVDAQKVVAELKQKAKKPIIVLTNEFKFGLEARRGFIRAGADGFFSFLPPWPTDAVKETLSHCVARSLADRHAAKSNAEPAQEG